MHLLARLLIVGACLIAAPALADPAAFDLPGPSLEVTVTRGTTSLPVAQVPSLASGDRVSIRAALTPGQSVHYLMVAAFLKGSTDPPPTNWFFRCETWTGRCPKDGLTLTVPAEAQQLLVFLAPETGGDYKTLVEAVRGRPGIFVRTSQDLNQASLEQLRLQAYLAAIRRLGESDPARLKEAAPLLSRSLAIKVDEKCLERTLVLQASCLMQGRDSLIMADGHGESVTQQLTSGPASDLAMEASNTPQLRSGYYGPFIGSMLDVARLFDSFHTAKYQYIPALAAPQGEELQLSLNAPPSFHDPKSVLVAALPSVAGAQVPRLRPVDVAQVYCVRKEPLVLEVDGAPQVFAGGYAHALRLEVTAAEGRTIVLPATPDAVRGGLTIDTAGLSAVRLADGSRGWLRGQWGFGSYEGPSFELVDSRAQAWSLAPGDEAALIVGRQDVVHLHAGSVRCVEDVALKDAAGRELKVDWRATNPDEVEARLRLEDERPGEVTLLIRQYGAAQPQVLSLRAYTEAAHLDGFALHLGDNRGVLKGTRLDEVEKLTLDGLEFTPDSLSTSAGHDELVMVEHSVPAVIDMKAGDAPRARVTLRDGRSYELTVAVEAPRPSATLIGKTVRLPGGSDGAIRIAGRDELPQGAELTFSLRAQVPAVFTRDEKIEVATLDGASAATLELGGGAMALQSKRVAVATLDPAKAFGPAAFGALHFRLLSHGVAGDWQPLATLVRLPVLKSLECADTAGSCQLSGQSLFLLDSVSADPAFGDAVAVADGFTGYALAVPHPARGQLYVKLRDDPSVISEVQLDGLEAPPPTAAPGGDPPAGAAPVVPVPAKAAPRAPAAPGAPGSAAVMAAEQGQKP